MLPYTNLLGNTVICEKNDLSVGYHYRYLIPVKSTLPPPWHTSCTPPAIPMPGTILAHSIPPASSMPALIWHDSCYSNSLANQNVLLQDICQAIVV
jgi:hypothetical protein